MATTVAVAPRRANVRSRSLLATTVSRRPPGASQATTSYSTSGWTAIARFAGSVHGVVVQISRPGAPGSRTLNRALNSPGFSAGNSTHTLGSSRSAYSSSASASAVRLAMLQCTGLSFRYTSPCSTNRANTSNVAASYSGRIVAYGRPQSPRMPRRWNWSLWRAMYFSAWSQQSLRTWSLSMSRSFGPTCSWILCSIGRPWQSHPGTYGA